MATSQPQADIACAMVLPNRTAAPVIRQAGRAVEADELLD
jgi:hypothetical protein